MRVYLWYKNCRQSIIDLWWLRTGLKEKWLSRLTPPTHGCAHTNTPSPFHRTGAARFDKDRYQLNAIPWLSVRSRYLGRGNHRHCSNPGSVTAVQLTYPWFPDRAELVMSLLITSARTFRLAKKWVPRADRWAAEECDWLLRNWCSSSSCCRSKEKARDFPDPGE